MQSSPTLPPSLHPRFLSAMSAAVARRVALVTGGNKGIGFEIVRQLATADPHLTVLLGARDAARGSASVAALALPNVAPLSLDVSSLPSIQAAAASVRQTYPTGLALLVNNAGVFHKQGSDHAGNDPKYVDDTLRVNYYGVRDMCTSMWPMLTKDARIVNVSSELAQSAMGKMSEARRAAFRKPDLTIAELDGLVSSFRDSWVANTVAAEGWPSSAYGLSKVAVSALSRILARDAKNGARSASEGASMIVHVCNLPASDRTTGEFWHEKSPTPL